MKGDTLASGGHSAQFSAGTTHVDDLVELKNVFPETEESFSVTDRRPSYLSLPSIGPEEEEEKNIDLNEYEPLKPILDRVLVKRVLTDPNLKELEDGSVVDLRTGIVTPAKHRQHSNIGVILAIGDFVYIGGTQIALSSFLKPGDRVTFGDYNSEIFHAEEEQVKEWCRQVNIPFVDDPESVRLIRAQDIRGVEHRRPIKGDFDRDFEAMTTELPSSSGLVGNDYTEAR